MGKLTPKAVLIVAAFGLFMTNVSGQVTHGYVIDKDTQKPLAYVNIGVIGHNHGVISRDDGAFKITLSRDLDDQLLRFSMIGYETQDFRISEITENLNIFLVPRNYALNEVVITGLMNRELRKLGRTDISKTTTGYSGDGEYGIGFEWGVRINNMGFSYKLKDCNFHMRFNTVDSALFRINVYNIKDSLPNESLLTKDISVKSYKKQKRITCDLSDQHIIIKGDIIATIEVVRVWHSKKGKNHFFLTHGKGYEQGGSYSRSTSQGPWDINTNGPLALYVRGWKTSSH